MLEVKTRTNASGQSYKVLLKDDHVIGSYSDKVKNSTILACYANTQKRTNRQINRTSSILDKFDMSKTPASLAGVKTVGEFMNVMIFNS